MNLMERLQYERKQAKEARKRKKIELFLSKISDKKIRKKAAKILKKIRNKLQKEDSWVELNDFLIEDRKDCDYVNYLVLRAIHTCYKSMLLFMQVGLRHIILDTEVRRYLDRDRKRGVHLTEKYKKEEESGIRYITSYRGWYF